jgi:glycosyltransferase A (GT-A) superfamily protein (DUF2064 family)
MIFTKAPLPGLTKTRLTTARGGILTPEEAADFYRAILLDVVDIGLNALDELNQSAQTHANGSAPDSYELVVSCSPASEQEVLKNALSEIDPGFSRICFITDSGESFDEHFDDAFRQLFRQGYHSVVSIGGDLPTLSPVRIVQAFQWLTYLEAISDRGAFVQAPCQECGVSLVGYTAATPMDSTGVFYNLDGVPALDAYVKKAAEKEIPTAILDPVADVDDVQDLAHAASVIRAIAYSSRFQPGPFVSRRTLAGLDRNNIVVATPPNQEHDPRERIDADN